MVLLARLPDDLTPQHTTSTYIIRATSRKVGYAGMTSFFISTNYMEASTGVVRRVALAAPFGIVFQSVMPLKDCALKDDAFSSLLREGEGLAILPTAGKYGETLAMPYAHLFRAFAHSLAQPQTVLFIIGYSGWDAHVNQIVEDALTNPGFSCVVIDPSPSEWARRLCAADYSGRVYCFGGEWGTFEFFAKHVMPDLEILNTELKVAATLRDLQKARSPQEFK